MIVGMNVQLVTRLLQDLGGTRGDHLVCVHIVTSTCAGLERINDKVFIPKAFHNFLGCTGDGVRPAFIDEIQLPIHLCGRSLYQSHGPNEGSPRAET